MKAPPSGQGQTQTLWDIYRWPLVLGLACGAGLVGALVGDGTWDVLASLLLAGPVLLCVRGMLRPPR